MTIYFGETFKSLRKKKDLTQEQIADILCVSPQAISRWETESTYPDISLLPNIADFFGVTVDDMLGTDKTKTQAKINDYINCFDKAMNNEQYYDASEIAHSAVKAFPNNYKLLNCLMYSMFVLGDNTAGIPDWQKNQEKYNEKIVEIGERILNYCTDDSIRLEAKSRLGFFYCDTGRKDKGRQIIETLPSVNSCREAVLYWALEGDERLSYLKEQTVTRLRSLIWTFNAYVKHADLNDTESSEWEHLHTKTKELFADKCFDYLRDNPDFNTILH